MKKKYDIASDIREAKSLPAEFYRDRAVFDALRERVFARSWQWIGHESEQEPGSVRVLSLLEGLIDEPIILTCDENRDLRCLSNVCTHRGNLVAQESGSCKNLRCGYHGRRFGLDGKFEFMPGFEGALNFPSETDDLPRIALESMRGFLFASLDPVHPMEALVDGMLSCIGKLPLAEFRLDEKRCREYTLNANWALYVDNYLEGLHVPYVHPGLSEVLDYEAYRIGLFPLSSLQLGIGKRSAPPLELQHSSLRGGEQVAGGYFWLFPNTMFNFYPWGLSINVVHPLALDRTRVSFYSYVWRPEYLEVGAGGALDQVEQEDERIVEQVQRGIASRIYDRGRYSPSGEKAVHHFHRLLTSAIE